MAHSLLAMHSLGEEWFGVSQEEAISAVCQAISNLESGLTSPGAKEACVQLRMPEDELAALDAWRAGQKIWARSMAIRKLVAEGIKREVRDVRS